VNAKLDRARVEQWIADGAFAGTDARTFWVCDGEDRLGLVRLYELSDPTPLLDVRIAARARGRGVGTQAVRLITDHAFSTIPTLRRIEAQTREDNVAMRRVLVKCGYVKEAHYREVWPVGDGTYLASVGYGVLRRDWADGTRTAVPWAD
jgi:RimJ/RimL family protein N-acetyltransferase